MVTMNQADLVDARVVQNTQDPAPPSGTPIPKVLPIDQAMPAGNGSGNTQRLSISEPAIGYKQIESLCPGFVSYSLTTGKYTCTGGTTSLDIPVDQQRFLKKGETFNNVSIWNWLLNPGTIPAFRVIYLQRLADPTRPWVSDAMGGNPNQWNPYRTVDAMTVDLTTFNGMSSTPDPLIATVAANHPLPGGNPTYHFTAHQRGEMNYMPYGTATEMNLWKQEPALKGGPSSPVTGWTVPAWSTTGGVAPTATDQYFAQPLNQSLGYLNKPFQPPNWATANPPGTAGDPQYPFPWLNWAYRPFFNEYELLQVTALSSSKLLARALTTTDPRHYFGYVDSPVRASTVQHVYDPLPAATPSNQVPYPHLLNFFESTKSSAWSSGTPPTPGFGAQLARIFAYVGVPSRFANTQLQAQAYNAGLNANSTPPQQGPLNCFHTPFNRISRYREPGRINPNTLTSPDVLFGAMNLYLNSPTQPPGMGFLDQTNVRLNPAFWDKFVPAGAATGPGARQGWLANTAIYVWDPGDHAQPDSRYERTAPSRFMQPYRTPGGESLTAVEPLRETEVGLLRGDPDVLTTSNSTCAALVPSGRFDHGDHGRGGATPDTFSMACMDYNRNPYFRYQAIQKLGGVFSNHSNVFAVWITVGYFQVLPASNPNAKDAKGNLIYPDGWQLGPELGSDAGDLVRHRAFYMFDRSIPVGFIRGQDINQANAVLVKRFIE